MKKLLAILLTLAMMVSICACSSSGGSADTGDTGNTASDTGDKDDSAASGDWESAPYADIAKDSDTVWGEKIRAGEKPLVGLVRSSINGENDILEYTNFTEVMESYGCEVAVNSFNDDYTLLQQQLENFKTQGGILAMVGAGDYYPVKDTLYDLKDSGITVCLIGWQPTFANDMGGGAATDFPGVGATEGKTASAWADVVLPDAGDGEIHYAQMRNDAVQPHIQLGDGCYEWLTENDSRFTRTYTDDLSVTLDDGFNSAEEALTSDPEIRVFFTNSDSAAVGINNYIMSRADLDPAEFCVIGFSSNTTGEIFSCLEKSYDNEGVVRGVVIGGVYTADDAEDTVSVGSATCGVLAASLIMTGQKQAPYWVLDDTWVFDSFGWEYINDLPENDEMPQIYLDYVERFGEITLGYTGEGN